MFDTGYALALGTVTDVSRDTDQGWIAVVALLDGGNRDEVETRFLWATPGDGSGVYAPVEVGAQVVVGFPHGDRNGAVVLGFPGSTGARPPTEWGNDVSAVYAAGGRHEVRSVDNPGAAVKGAVLAPLLDDLSTFLGGFAALKATLTGLGAATGVDATVINGALTALKTLCDTAATLKGQVDTSKANGGQAPHASAVLRAALS